MLTLIFISVIIAIILPTVDRVHGLNPLVQTKVGLIKGLKASDGEYSMFLGIPYAKVNESNPFGLATPYGEFNGTFEAFEDSVLCPQIEEFNRTVTGSLDCLQLNIYVPNTAGKGNALAVLVYIHGGGFLFGSAGRHVHGPKYLVQHDVILVTLNYRLGPYGFMCHGTPDVPGNQGLKDQVLALRWIRENIAAFGGDAKRVTLFGNSSGGSAIDLHLHSPQEKLFNNIILESGTAHLSGFNKGSEKSTLKLAAQLGYKTDRVDEAVTFLAKINTSLVIEAASKINCGFLRCIEKGDNGEKFITDYPINTDIPKVKNMSVLIGNNDEEMLLLYKYTTVECLGGLKLFYNKLKNVFNFDEEQLKDLEASVRHFYIGDEKVLEKVKDGVTDFEADSTFYYPVQLSLNKYINSGAQNVFYYMFGYNGTRNYAKHMFNITSGKAAHADEIGYLFDISYMREVPSNEDQVTIDRLTTLWTNFAKYSDPTPTTSNLLPVKWEPVTKDSLNYYHIDTDLSLGNRPFKERLAFWDLFFKYYFKYLKGYKPQNRSQEKDLQCSKDQF